MKPVHLPYRAIYVSILLNFINRIIKSHTESGCGIVVPESQSGLGVVCLGFNADSFGEPRILVPIKILDKAQASLKYNISYLDDVLKANGIKVKYPTICGCYVIGGRDYMSLDERRRQFRRSASPTVSNEELLKMKNIVLSNLNSAICRMEME